MTRTELMSLLADGHTYLWALRRAYVGEQEVEAARAELAALGIDVAALAALRELEASAARFAHPSASRPSHEYLDVPIPPDGRVFLSPVLTERGVEVGTEVFPAATSWTFAHREIQYCTGGVTDLEALLPHGATERARFGAGDVMAIPAGTRIAFTPAAGASAFEHSHVYLLNLPQGEPQTFYDIAPLLRLQQRGIVAAAHELPPPLDLRERVEVRDWSALASARPGASNPLPTWLRNGWAARDATRALDYHEGTRSLMLAAPDREPDAYLPWGEGESRCWVNPLIAEHSAAITDCRFPAGYFRSQPATELWTILRGAARIRQTMPPLHADTHVAELAAGAVLVVPGGARVFVDDAEPDLVVRRLASSSAANGHWAMMERKLLDDGVPAQL